MSSQREAALAAIEEVRTLTRHDDGNPFYDRTDEDGDPDPVSEAASRASRLLQGLPAEDDAFVLGLLEEAYAEARRGAEPEAVAELMMHVVGRRRGCRARAGATMCRMLTERFGSEYVRFEICEELGEMHEREPTLRALRFALDDPADLRGIVLRRLGDLRDHDSIPIMVDALEDPKLRWSALEALSNVDSPEAVAALERYAERSEDPRGIDDVSHALKQAYFGSKPDEDELCRAGSDPNHLRRAAALLVRCSQVENHDPVVAGFRSLEPVGRKLLVRLLYDYRDSSVDLLREVASTDPDPVVRRVARYELGEHLRRAADQEVSRVSRPVN